MKISKVFEQKVAENRLWTPFKIQVECQIPRLRTIAGVQIDNKNIP